ncbi:MAG TPA: hypothetical protein DCE41_01365 [Cytophagales bacterium]|nr:hypothetical protein [Cytophagales bacterium]
MSGMRYQRYSGIIAGFTDPYLILGASTTQDDELVFAGNSAAKMDVRLLDGVLKIGGSASPFSQLSRDELTNSWVGGNLGVGTDNPRARLHVNGDMMLPRASVSSVGEPGEFLKWGTPTGPGIASVQLAPDNDVQGLVFYTHPSAAYADQAVEAMRITAAGQVCVGSDTPDGNSLLTLAGGMASREVKVTVTAGNDKVFESDYPLMDLRMLDHYVSTEKHLPGIAPERVMLQEGVQLGEFSIQLLGKIEELTLYTIDQQKQLQAQQKALEAMQSKIDELQTQLDTK